LPSISRHYSDKMIGMPEVNLCMDFTTAQRQKGIAVFLHDFVESLEVDAKVEGAILLAEKEDWSGMSRRGRAD
ncbi:hypothetical protein PAXRUDRAFT_143484, partial [Paxillus rubicundulus Ve08.2h10]